MGRGLFDWEWVLKASVMFREGEFLLEGWRPLSGVVGTACLQSVQAEAGILGSHHFFCNLAEIRMFLSYQCNS